MFGCVLVGVEFQGRAGVCSAGRLYGEGCQGWEGSMYGQPAIYGQVPV
jgi:hypothetical protein